MSKIKILIVEDEALVAMDLKSALTKMYFKVTDIVQSYEAVTRSIKEC